MSYLSYIYLESLYSWLWGGALKKLKKRRQQAEGKHSNVKRKKSEKCEGSLTTTTYILGFKLHFVRKHSLKKSCSYHQILFTVFMRSRIFKKQ